MSVAIWVKPPGGMWTHVGERGSPRVIPSSVSLDADDTGPTAGTFQIVSDTRIPDDLFRFASTCIVEIDGMRAWKGQVLDLARADRTGTVTLQGTAAQMADAPATFTPVDSGFDAWDDWLTTSGAWATNTQNSVNPDGILLGWSTARTDVNTGNGGTPAPGLTTTIYPDFNAITYRPEVPNFMEAVSVTFDVLQTVTYLHLCVLSAQPFYVFETATGSSDNPMSMVAAGAGSPGAYVWGDVFIGSASGPTTLFCSQDSHGPQGMLCVGVYLNNSAGGAPYNNGHVPKGAVVRIKNITVWDDATQMDASGNSLVTGSYLAKRLARMMPGAAQAPDLSGIQTTTNITKNFAYSAATPVGQMLADAALLDDAVAKLDPYDRVIFRPRAATAAVEVGAGAPPSQETPQDPSTLTSWVEIQQQPRANKRRTDPNAPVTAARFSVLDLPETPRVLLGAPTAPPPALVGSPGAVASGTTAFTPAWGAGASRTAGNTLFCIVACGSSGTISLPATPAGWTADVSYRTGSGSLNHSGVMILRRVATGTDAAPTITPATGTCYAQLYEFNGVATTSAVDETATAAAGASATAPHPDATSPELVIYAATAHYSTAQVDSLFAVQPQTGPQWTPNTSSNPLASANVHYALGYGLTPQSATQTLPDSLLLNFTQVNADDAAIAIASYNLGAATSPTPVGPLQPGVPYALVGDYRSGVVSVSPLNDEVGTAGVMWMVGEDGNFDGTCQPIEILYDDATTWTQTTFVPAASWAGVRTWQGYGGKTLQTELYAPAGVFTGVARGGSLSVNAPLRSAEQLALAQAWLREQNRLSYTQSRPCADGRLRDAQTGASLPAVAALLHTGELARSADRVDPVDGKVGAVGYVSGVTYDHATRQATVTLGQRFESVDELLLRLPRRKSKAG